MAASAAHRFRLNGRDVNVEASPGTALVFVLRNQLGIVSPKLGCGTEQCGACRVLVDGKLAYSCTLPLEEVVGRNVDTLERFTAHPVVAALLRHNAGQCGICLPGIAIAAIELFERSSHPTDVEIAAALAPQLCRCGAQPRILRALRELARQV
jgi:nicotinate dehydrogenase subunit A